MTAILDSTSAPKFQIPDLWNFSRCTPNQPTTSFDPALSLWRAWRDTVLIELEAVSHVSPKMTRTRRDDAAERYYDHYNARVAALTALRQCRSITPVALAARLHAVFFQTYEGATSADRRDPAYQAEAAMLQDLLPAVPDELAADITATLNGLGLAGEA